MMRMRERQRGASGSEYGLKVGLVAVVALTALLTIGSELRATFDNIRGYVGAADAVVGASGKVAAEADPGAGTLVPGDTSAAVSRYGYSATCTAWDGDLCLNAYIRPDADNLGVGDAFQGRWFGLDGGGDTARVAVVRRAFCKIATGDPAHADGDLDRRAGESVYSPARVFAYGSCWTWSSGGQDCSAFDGLAIDRDGYVASWDIDSGSWSNHAHAVRCAAW